MFSGLGTDEFENHFKLISSKLKMKPVVNQQAFSFSDFDKDFSLIHPIGYIPK